MPFHAIFSWKGKFQSKKTISVEKDNFSRKRQFQSKKTISVEKYNFSWKRQFQLKKTISVEKDNFSWKRQFQLKKYFKFKKSTYFSWKSKCRENGSLQHKKIKELEQSGTKLWTLLFINRFSTICTDIVIRRITKGSIS